MPLFPLFPLWCIECILSASRFTVEKNEAQRGKCLAQGHIARRWQDRSGYPGVSEQSLCPGLLDSQDRAARLMPGLDILSSARETVQQMVSAKPADFHAPMARDGHLLGLGKAKAAPPGPGRPPHSRATKSAASHQSSLTSLEGSGISERFPQKSLHQAGGPHLEVGVHRGPGSGPQRAFCLQAFAHTIPSGDACSCRCQS